MPASFGRAGAGRQHDGVRIGRDHVRGRDLVVAMDLDLRPEPTQIVEQVEGEAVVVVNEQDHGHRYFAARIGNKSVFYFRWSPPGTAYYHQEPTASCTAIEPGPEAYASAAIVASFQPEGLAEAQPFRVMERKKRRLP